jgi:hypothetical protein
MNPAMRPKTTQPMMDIGFLRFADFNAAFALHWYKSPSAAFYKAPSAYFFKRNVITKVIAIANTTQASSKSCILPPWRPSSKS